MVLDKKINLFKRVTPNVRLGMFYILLSMMAYTVASSFVKAIAPTFPINEIVFFRALFSLPLVFFLAYQSRHLGGLKIRYVWLQSFLILLSLLGTGCSFASYNHLPFADATAINYTSPFFAVIAAIWIMREHPNLWQTAAMCTGFLGLIAIARPTFESINIGVILALACAGTDGLCTTTGRYFAQRGLHVSSLSFYYSLICTVLSGLTLPFSYAPPTSDILPFLIATGIFTGCGQYLFLKGIALTPTAIGAPLIYTSIALSALIGYVIWNESLALMTLIGIGLIVLSGIKLSITIKSNT